MSLPANESKEPREEPLQGPWRPPEDERKRSKVRSFRARFRERFLHMVGRDDPPELVAASFALGVAISFTPMFGFHTLLALFLAFLLKLNKVDMLIGTLVMNPLTLGPVSVGVAVPLGRFLLRARREAIRTLPWHEVFSRSFWTEAAPRMRALSIQWAVGMFALSFLVGALTYVLLVNLIRHHREKVARSARPEPLDRA